MCDVFTVFACRRNIPISYGVAMLAMAMEMGIYAALIVDGKIAGTA
jgi:hypothetical protein